MSDQLLKDFNVKTLTEQQRREIKRIWDIYVDEFSKQIEKEYQLNFSNLAIARSLSVPWYDNPGLFHIDAYESIITQAVTDQWGISAKVMFDRVNRSITCTHDSGLTILI